MTVLYSEPIILIHWWVVFLIFLGIFFIIALIISIYQTHNVTIHKFHIFITVLFAIITVMLLLLAITGLDHYDSGRKRYMVVLEDDYNDTDLYEDYKVIEQKGLIWIIEDKKEGKE